MGDRDEAVPTRPLAAPGTAQSENQSRDAITDTELWDDMSPMRLPVHRAQQIRGVVARRVHRRTHLIQIQMRLRNRIQQRIDILAIGQAGAKRRSPSQNQLFLILAVTDIHLWHSVAETRGAASAPDICYFRSH